jgi:hypothetical protein
MGNRFYFDKGIRNSRVARPVSGRVFNWLTIIAAAGLLLSCGFVLSARKHFEAIAVGYKGEEMRRQSAQLEERLRALEMDYARESSPFEIERRASQLGLQRPGNSASTPPSDQRTPERERKRARNRDQKPDQEPDAKINQPEARPDN